MKSNKMMFKDYVFDKNPEKILVKTSKNITKTKIPDGVTVVRENSSNCAVVTGNGKIFGSDCIIKAYRLKTLHKRKGAGKLCIPNMDAFDAIFSELTYEYNSEKNYVSYSFRFDEVETEKKDNCFFTYTFANSGENAFDVSARTGISIDKIMMLNNFKSPFDIAEGDKVIIK